MSEKTGAEAVAQSIAEAKESATKAVEEVKSLGEGLKDLTKGLTEGFAKMGEIRETEEIKSLKSELEVKSAEANNLKEKLKLADAGQGSSSNNQEEVKSLIAIAQTLQGKKKVGLEEFKSIRLSDPTSSGYRQTETIYGAVNINEQSLYDIINDISTIPATNKTDNNSAWQGYDESAISLEEINEKDTAATSAAIERSKIVLMHKKRAAKILVSSNVVEEVSAGNVSSAGILKQNFSALESKYNRLIAKQVYQDVIAAVNLGNVGKTASTTAEAPADAQAKKDLRLFLTTLKVQHLNNATLYVSRPFINALFSEEASDGHLTLEQFMFDQAGLTRYLSLEKAIPMKVFEHEQIGNYLSLADGSTSITTDWVDGSSTNTGKLLAFVGDMKKSYFRVPSTVGTTAIDDSIASIASESCLMLKTGYDAQGIILREGIKAFYAS